MNDVNGFGGTVIQAVVHHLKNGSNLTISFGSTVD